MLPASLPRCFGEASPLVYPAICRTDAGRERAMQQLTNVSLEVLGKSRRGRWVGTVSWSLVGCPPWFEVIVACISSVHS